MSDSGLGKWSGSEMTDDSGVPGDVLIVIRSLMPSLAPAEQRLAQAVLADPGGVAHQTISELARACQTSETTVVRFCRAIGLRGYPALRLSLAAASVQNSGPEAYVTTDIDPLDDLQTVVRKIAHADARAIEDTLEHLDLEVLEQVVAALVAARRIDLYGVGASGFVALDLQQKLQRIAKPAYAWPDAHMAITSAALLEPGDLAIGMTHTGTTIDTLDALREARSHGATTVALTNFPRSPAALEADMVLLTAARETIFRSGATASRIAQLVVVDCLFVAVAREDYPATQRALQRTFTATLSKRVGRLSKS